MFLSVVKIDRCCDIDMFVFVGVVILIEICKGLVIIVLVVVVIVVSGYFVILFLISDLFVSMWNDLNVKLVLKNFLRIGIWFIVVWMVLWICVCSDMLFDGLRSCVMGNMFVFVMFFINIMG